LARALDDAHDKRRDVFLAELLAIGTAYRDDGEVCGPVKWGLRSVLEDSNLSDARRAAVQAELDVLETLHRGATTVIELDRDDDP
jgi:hypothetical protein